MIKKRILLFTVLVVTVAVFFAITAFAANEPVSYKVNVNGNVIERHTSVEVLYKISTSNNDRIIMGLNPKVEGFTAEQIVEVHVPYGIAEVNINIVNTSVKTIIFDDYCSARVGSLQGFNGLEKIEISGLEATLTFAANCSPTAIKELVVTSPRTTLTFSAEAFKGRTNLKTVSFGRSADVAKPSSFKFEANCFQNTGIEALAFDDPFSVYNFSGASAFANNTKLKNVYIGKNIKTIGTQTFDYCPALELVYIQDVTSIPNYTFRVTSGTEKSPLKVYIHTEGKVTFGSNAFDGRNQKGVTVCVLESNVTSFSSCKYELHYGVQHKYEPASEVATCYTSYATDCPCARVGNAYYTLYASGQSSKTVKYVAGPNPDVPHTFNSVHRMEYANGIDNAGVAELKCGVCGTIEGVERPCAPVVEFPGYSVSETGNRAMVVGVRFNYATLKQYEEITGETLEYGLVMAAYAPLNGNMPINDKGLAYSGSVYVFNMAKNGVYDSTLKLTGIKDSMLDTEFIMSAYIKIGDEIIYIEENGETKTPSTLTYSQLIK
ncbi:MAG: leucine-rich repeat protein [Clostridia bacterium]|nr:leucine-rich repeat protein [Clostridia bacterium]